MGAFFMSFFFQFEILFLYLQCVTLLRHIERVQGRLASNAGIFYACKDIGYIVPPRISYNGNTASVQNVLRRGKGNIPFFISLNA